MAVIEAIATTYLEAAAASVTFSSLGSYEHLQIRVSGRDNYAGSGGNSIYIRFNGDTGSNYSTHTMAGATSTAMALKITGEAKIYVFNGTHGSSVVAGEYAALILDVLDYRNTNKNTTVQYVTSTTYVTTSFSHSLICGAILWDNTAAVTSITLSDASGLNGGIRRNSELTLYGIKSS